MDIQDKRNQVLGLSMIKVGKTYQVMHGNIKTSKVTILTKPTEDGYVWVKENFYGNETTKLVNLKDYGVIPYENGKWELTIRVLK